MKQGRSRVVAAGSLVCALMLGSAGHAALAIPVDRDFGSASEEQNAERVIKIAPDAKWVNVTEADTSRSSTRCPVNRLPGRSIRSWAYST